MWHQFIHYRGVMGDKEDKDGEQKDGDERLWHAAMRDVRPLPKQRGIREKKAGTSQVRTAPVTVREVVMPPPKAQKRAGNGLDRSTDDKLKRGQMEIEARLDLHGYRLKEAEAELVKTLTRWQGQGKRCVLVITGQGNENKMKNPDDWWDEKPGLLRKAVPEWLKAPPLAEIVLQFHIAKQHHGGAGALYVLLRRNR